jgi:DNA-binding transcriptional MerR regulator
MRESMLHARVDDGYGTAEVCRRIGISARQLEYWVLIGVVTPRGERHGSKLFKRYSDNDLWILKSVKDLTDEGFLVSRAVERLRRLFPERFERG